MSVDRLKRDLLSKLINARIDLDTYLTLRKAKGYMSVSESDHLRDNFFELCNYMREKAPLLREHCSAEEQAVLYRAVQSLSAVGVCMMTGGHDCPTFIAVNAEKLEVCLTDLTRCIQSLKTQQPLNQN
ncbi:biofilm formation regulator BssR [Leclercia pneumoniae]|uniref:biofilm formation regulator BssR n=1 Tax=Leclercia pneumoniae TaxID=2815358 RepID=UPI003AF7F504